MAAGGAGGGAADPRQTLLEQVSCAIAWPMRRFAIPHLPAGSRGYLFVVLLATLATPFFDSDLTPGFARLFGSMPPLAVMLIVLALALWACFQIASSGFAADRTGASLTQAVGLFAAGFALSLLPIGIDLLSPFPSDINIALPSALIFYSVIALVAETLFHLVPLAAILLVLRSAPHPALVLLPVAAIEPLFQFLLTPGPLVQLVLMTAHVTLFNLVQLAAFYRFGVVAMLVIRLGFYLGWHILWGWFRLEGMP